MLSATTPSKKSLIFEVQSERMKKNVNILAHLSQTLVLIFQAFGNKTFQKQLQVWNSIRKNEKRYQHFSSFEPSLGLTYEQTT
jgi:hypothetical protein